MVETLLAFDIVGVAEFVISMEASAPIGLPLGSACGEDPRPSKAKFSELSKPTQEVIVAAAAAAENAVVVTSNHARKLEFKNWGMFETIGKLFMIAVELDEIFITTASARAKTELAPYPSGFAPALSAVMMSATSPDHCKQVSDQRTQQGKELTDILTQAPER